MKRGWLAAVLCSTLGACSSIPVQMEARAAAKRLPEAAERYIVAGVENARVAPPGRAGSTPRGYDGLTSYGPSPRARQLLRDLEKDYGLREVAAWPIEPLHMHCAVLEVPADADRTSILASLAHDQRIRIAQPLQTFSTHTEVYNDPYVALQTGFQQMDVADAHPWSRGTGVRIAIIDTGADTTHPDLRGTIVRAANFVDADEQQFRNDRHGTEIAGVIAAVANNRQGIVGVAPGARLMVFKACWQLQANADPAQCNSFTLAQALIAALDAHAQIVNLSLVGPEDPLLHDLISEGLRRGVLFVGATFAGAAGGGNPLLQHNGVGENGVIEVASAAAQSRNGARLYAPGREILTLLPGGHYEFASGSSLATAHVTGTVALLLAMNPKLSAAAVYRLLQDTTAHIATDAGVVDSVDACAAVVAIAGRGACRRATPTENRLANGGESRIVMH